MSARPVPVEGKLSTGQAYVVRDHTFLETITQPTRRASCEPPAGVDADTWFGLGELASRTVIDGGQVTAADLAGMPTVDVGVLMDAAEEVARREATFRRGARGRAPRDLSAGAGDGLEPEGAPEPASGARGAAA